MYKEVTVAGSEDEAPTELERVLSQSMLAVSSGFCSLPSREIVAAHQMQQAGRLQSDGLVGDAVGVDQKREFDTRLLAKGAGVGSSPETDGGDRRSSLANLLLVVTQLRDMLAAENSPVVAQEYDHDRGVVPEASELGFVTVGIRKAEARQGVAVGFCHDGLIIPICTPFSKINAPTCRQPPPLVLDS